MQSVRIRKVEYGERKKTVSFVIPCYRSEHTLENVVAEIHKTLKDMEQYDYEIILVNDCSPDGTWAVIRRICQENHRIRGINFAKNFGQHAALMAGLRQSSGDYVVCGRRRADSGGRGGQAAGKVGGGL